MDEDTFWGIIEESRVGHDDSQDKQETKLEGILSKLTVPEIIAFDRIFTQLRFRAYTHDLWGAAYIIDGGCSDDGFEYFRCGLIASGREKYEKALLDLESLTDWAHPDETEFEALMYVADRVYKVQTHTNDYIKHPDLKYPPISGEAWSENNGDLERRFPKLWAKFSS